MRAVAGIASLILLSACMFERGTAPPQPQKAALSQCYSGQGHYPPTPCTKPIFIVDGKRLADDGIDLNPSEIESVEVMKGPTAVQAYGEDARNGVVLITTKRAPKESK
jgi:TonB-dependent SusC/RagA subfamily outer membrane receptor